MNASAKSGDRPYQATTSGPWPWNLEARESAILTGILVATAIIYMPSLRNGWVWDDWDQIVRAGPLHSWSGIWKSFIYDSWWFRDPAKLPQSAYYRPLQASWFALNYMLLGNHPAAWHLEKIALHVIAVLLSFRLAQLLSGSAAVALLTAALFGMMPAQAEGVVWASGIGEPLTTILELGAMIFLIGRGPGWSRGLIAALILFACAMLTHESAILFPPIVAAYAFLFESGDQVSAKKKAQAVRIRRRIASALRTCAPFLAVVIAYMCARASVLGINLLFGFNHDVTGSMLKAGLEVSGPRYSAAQVLMTVPGALIDYLGVLAVPTMAGPTHAVEWVKSPEPIFFIAAAALALVAGATLVQAWGSSNRRIYLFCAAWSFFTIAPALNLNALFWLVDDRYLYAPSFGWSLAVAVTALQIAASGARARRAVAAATAVLLTAYALSTIRTERYWHDDVTFFQRCVAIVPDNSGYRVKLAAAMDKAGDHNGAARALEHATTLEPDNWYFHLLLSQQYQRAGQLSDYERENQKFNELFAAMMKRRYAAKSSDPSQPAGTP